MYPDCTHAQTHLSAAPETKPSAACQHQPAIQPSWWSLWLTAPGVGTAHSPHQQVRHALGEQYRRPEHCALPRRMAVLALLLHLGPQSSSYLVLEAPATPSCGSQTPEPCAARERGATMACQRRARGSPGHPNRPWRTRLSRNFFVKTNSSSKEFLILCMLNYPLPKKFANFPCARPKKSQNPARAMRKVAEGIRPPHGKDTRGSSSEEIAESLLAPPPKIFYTFRARCHGGAARRRRSRTEFVGASATAAAIS